jgi:hypothetical protein
MVRLGSLTFQINSLIDAVQRKPSLGHDHLPPWDHRSSSVGQRPKAEPALTLVWKDEIDSITPQSSRWTETDRRDRIAMGQ